MQATDAIRTTLKFSDTDMTWLAAMSDAPPLRLTFPSDRNQVVNW